MAWQKKPGWTGNRRVKSGWSKTVNGWPKRAGWGGSGRGSWTTPSQQQARRPS